MHAQYFLISLTPQIFIFFHFFPATCLVTNGTTANVAGIDCTCGTADCTSTTGMYCARSHNKCYPNALPGPPRSIEVSIASENILQVVIEPDISYSDGNILKMLQYLVITPNQLVVMFRCVKMHVNRMPGAIVLIISRQVYHVT